MYVLVRSQGQMQPTYNGLKMYKQCKKLVAQLQTPKVKKILPQAGTFIRAPPFEFFSTNIDFRLCCRQDSCLNYTFFIFLPIVALLGWMVGWGPSSSSWTRSTWKTYNNYNRDLKIRTLKIFETFTILATYTYKQAEVFSTHKELKKNTTFQIFFYRV